MNLAIVGVLLRSLSTAATLVDSSKKGAAISSTLNYAATLVEKGAEGEAKLEDFTAHVEAIVKGGGLLTESDFDDLKKRSDDAHNAIQSS